MFFSAIRRHNTLDCEAMRRPFAWTCSARSPKGLRRGAQAACAAVTVPIQQGLRSHGSVATTVGGPDALTALRLGRLLTASHQAVSDQSRLAIGFYLGTNSLNRHAAPVGRGVVPGLPANGKGLRTDIAAEFGPFVVAGPGRGRRVERTNSRDPAGGSISPSPSRCTVRSRPSCGRAAIKI